MKNFILCFSFLFVLCLISCGDETSSGSTTSKVKQDTNTTPEQKQLIKELMNPDPTTQYNLCFRNVQAYANEENAEDIEELKLSFDKGIVKGVFNSIPAFRDARWGKIEGTEHTSQVNGKYIYVENGKIDTVKIKIILRQDLAIIYAEPVELGIAAEITISDCATATAE